MGQILKNAGGIVLILVLFLVVAVPGNVQGEANRAGDLFLRIGKIRAPANGSEVCLGEDLDITLRISQSSKSDPTFDVGIPGAIVKVDDGQSSISGYTREDGTYFHSLVPEKEGKLTLTVNAKTSSGISATPILMTYEVIACENWLLMIEFKELYPVINDVPWYVLGEVIWTDVISLQPDFQQSEKHSGLWFARNLELMDNPLGATFNQKTEGEFDILWSAEKHGDQITIKFKTKSVEWPPDNLAWEFLLMTANLNTFAKDFNPQQVPVGYGNGRFLELNGITELTFDANTSSVTVFNLSQPVFFNSPPATINQMTVHFKVLPKNDADN